MHWYEININPGRGGLGGVFKLCLSLTLSSFEYRSEDVLILRGECRDFTNFEVRTNMSLG